MRSSLLPNVLALVLAMVVAGGCAATVSGGAYGPELVAVSPGVQVIADYDEPIFFSDGLYWRYDGGVWYRSTYYTGGWVYARPPGALLRIDRPYAYRHYRPAGWRGQPGGPRVAAGPGWRGAPPPAPAAGLRGAPPPAGGLRGAPPPAGGWRGAPPPAAARAPAARPAPVRAAPSPRRGWRR